MLGDEEIFAGLLSSLFLRHGGGAEGNRQFIVAVYIDLRLCQ